MIILKVLYSYIWTEQEKIQADIKNGYSPVFCRKWMDNAGTLGSQAIDFIYTVIASNKFISTE